jgi:hypothetical protein
MHQKSLRILEKMKQDGVKSDIRLSAGSYGTAQAEWMQRIRKGKFSSIVGLNYGRTDGHRLNNEFSQYTTFYCMELFYI